MIDKIAEVKKILDKHFERRWGTLPSDIAVCPCHRDIAKQIDQLYNEAQPDQSRLLAEIKWQLVEVSGGFIDGAHAEAIAKDIYAKTASIYQARIEALIEWLRTNPNQKYKVMQRAKMGWYENLLDKDWDELKAIHTSKGEARDH